MNILRSSLAYYLNSFRGFSREVWWLALATLVNRAGAMVLPFLSLYLTSALNFSLQDVGWIMSAFGLGSFAGAWLGGELAHKFGAYRSMIFSLISSAVFFVILGQLTSFWGISLGIFTVAMASDIFRPAVFVSLAAYARPENRVRAITLIRLAINLGFSLGPAVGGLIIVFISYQSLFWIDGVTCFLAGIIILIGLVEKRTQRKEKAIDTRHSHRRILSDARFMLFLGAVFLFCLLFVQYFSVIPVYYKGLRGLSEDEVGWLLSLNGLLIFLVEMPIIYALDKRSTRPFLVMVIGSVCLMLSFVFLFIPGWTGVLVVGMVLATFAEIFCFPYSNNYAMQRGGAGNEGRYMAYYAMTFSLAHIVGHNFGMQVSDQLGFETLFVIMTLLSLVSVLLFALIGRKENQEELTAIEQLPQVLP
ncbi:MFS transporter [Reichenbachiella agarivorans]|uniref:MFS transporter n=1 Tax=Reichenbachiella agarivorans TaxID=2979464 RepID=A0ABY6CM42_9BACT|nr:MFS transporter [Reichenbachiella agarivorans]UXP31150.1 MFS transporter [Reichenbachiella agarivorans]